MNKLRFTVKLAVIATFLFAFASVAQAQASRTWVSGVGDDANPCSRTAPCKTFAGAISKTATNGEIDCLDPGGFGAVTITKGITIDGTTGAGFGSILSSLVNGIVVNDTTGNGVVTLRNLSINGISNGLNGIRFLAGKALIVEGCQIFGFIGNPASTQGRGIDVSLGADTKNVVVRNTSIQNVSTGIRITTSSGNVTGNFENVRIDQPSAIAAPAIELGTGGIAVIRNSFITRYQTGISVTGAAPNASAIVLGTTIWNCTTGIAAGNTTLRMSDSSIINNTTGVSLSGGTFRSGCDNFFENNTTPVSGGAITNACVQ
jgi:hypothetical protein